MSMGLIMTMAIGVMLSGCNDMADNSNPALGPHALPNPADVRCVEAGYQIENVSTHGVPTSSYCVDEKSGQKCEAWAYFRGECKLPLAKGRDI